MTEEDVVLIDSLITANGQTSHHIAWKYIKKHIIALQEELAKANRKLEHISDDILLAMQDK